MRRIGQSLCIPICLFVLSCILIPEAKAAVYTVTVFTDNASGGLAGTGAGNAGDLRNQILSANAAGGADTITFACGAPPCTITLSGPLPAITSDLTIDGGTMGNIVIDGASAYRAFFVDVGTVALQNLVIQNGRAQGGAGGSGDGGGGGGAGLGGGLFVNKAGAGVALTNVRFINCSAVGGAGGNFLSNAWAGGGGGGLTFRGGNSTANTGGAGGGGVQGAGADVSLNFNGGDGGAGGGGGGGRHNTGVGGSGSAGYATNAGGSAANVGVAGAGGFGGGGGGAAINLGGIGGFGGGGGGTGGPTRAGNGGPGGGGGGPDGGIGMNGTGGSLGSGMKGGDGGAGSGGGGGGGAAVGPAIFVNAGALAFVNTTATGSSATAGGGGTGQAGHHGAAGTADSTSLFNCGGAVNGSWTTGPLTLLDMPPSVANYDGDGVPDWVEQGPDGNNLSYDGNGDGIPDWQQGNVSSFHAVAQDGSRHYMTLAAPSGRSIEYSYTSRTFDTPPPERVTFPYGFFSFGITGLPWGGSTTMTIYLDGKPPQTYYKYGKTPDNRQDHWYEFSYDGQTGAEVVGNTVVLHFVDGKRGDHDLEENGRIGDPGGPARIEPHAALFFPYLVSTGDERTEIGIINTETYTASSTVSYYTETGDSDQDSCHNLGAKRQGNYFVRQYPSELCKRDSFRRWESFRLYKICKLTRAEMRMACRHLSAEVSLRSSYCG